VLRRKIGSDGGAKVLRRELAKDLRTALKPAAADAKGALRGAVRSTGATKPALVPAIARTIRPQINLTARRTGASIRVRKTPKVRNFANAPMRFNRRAGWRHKVWGKDVWVHQTGAPGWFDNAMKRGRPQYRAAIKKALDNYAGRLAGKG